MSWEGVSIDCDECGGFDDVHTRGCKNENGPFLKNAPPPTSIERERIGAFTIDELFAHVDELERTRDFFADELWKLEPGDPPNLCLMDPLGREYYSIELIPMKAADALKWIAQIVGKAWCSERIMGSLVRCLDEIYDLQKVAHAKGRTAPKMMTPGGRPGVAKSSDGPAGESEGRHG